MFNIFHNKEFLIFRMLLQVIFNFIYFNNKGVSKKRWPSPLNTSKSSSLSCTLRCATYHCTRCDGTHQGAHGKPRRWTRTRQGHVWIPGKSCSVVLTPRINKCPPLLLGARRAIRKNFGINAVGGLWTMTSSRLNEMNQFLLASHYSQPYLHSDLGLLTVYSKYGLV